MLRYYYIVITEFENVVYKKQIPYLIILTLMSCLLNVDTYILRPVLPFKLKALRRDVAGAQHALSVFQGQDQLQPMRRDLPFQSSKIPGVRMPSVSKASSLEGCSFPFLSPIAVAQLERWYLQNT